MPFFVGLTFAGGVAALAAHPPFVGSLRTSGEGSRCLAASCGEDSDGTVDVEPQGGSVHI